MLALGDAFSAGTGVEQDAVRAVGWYQKAADQGDTTALQHLAYACATGEGTKKDETRAVKYFSRPRIWRTHSQRLS